MRRSVFMSLLVAFILAFCITAYAREPITDINLEITHTQNEITINDIHIQANTPHYVCERKEFQPVTKHVMLYLRADDGFVFQTKNASQVVLNGAKYVTAKKMENSSLLVLTVELTENVIWLEDRGGWENSENAIKYKYEDGHYASEGWNQIGDKHYYFDGNGNLLINTQTPDGYKVGADGAKIEISTIINVEGLSSQQDGYIVTYQYFNVFQEYGNTKYQAIIEIQNTGEENLYLGTSTFDIYDKSGNIVASETFISSDPDVIAPGEKGYFYSNGGYLDNVPMGDYVLRPRITVEKTNLPATRYTVEQSSLKTSEFGKNPTIVGTVTNNTDKNEGLLWIVAVFYDKNNLPIGICGTNILDFNAGITTGFELEGWHLPEYITVDKISRFEVIAAPTQYQF